MAIWLFTIDSQIRIQIIYDNVIDAVGWLTAIFLIRILTKFIWLSPCFLTDRQWLIAINVQCISISFATNLFHSTKKVIIIRISRERCFVWSRWLSIKQYVLTEHRVVFFVDYLKLSSNEKSSKGQSYVWLTSIPWDFIRFCMENFSRMHMDQEVLRWLWWLKIPVRLRTATSQLNWHHHLTFREKIQPPSINPKGNGAIIDATISLL